MRVFVSGKIGVEAGAQPLIRGLRERGHEITFDWTKVPHLRPYEAHEHDSANAAREEIEGVAQADVLVLVSHERGVGMFVELGAALALGKPVIAVASPPARTMFFFHPLVTMVDTSEAVYGILDQMVEQE